VAFDTGQIKSCVLPGVIGVEIFDEAESIIRASIAA